MFAPRADEASELERLLTDRLESQPVDLTLIAQGAWSRCYASTRNDRAFVVRIGEHRDDYERDARAMRFSSPRLPVPEILEIGQIGDACYAIGRRVKGEHLGAVSPDARTSVISSLFVALDAAREANLADTTGYGLWNGSGTGGYASWPEYLREIGRDVPGRRTFGWRGRLAGSPSNVELFDDAYRELETMLPSLPEVRTLIHADLLNDNVLINEGRVAAVLDWGCSLYGDFLYDVGWLAFGAFWYPTLRGMNFVALARAHYAEIGLVVPDFDTRVRTYLIHIGLDAMVYNAFIGNRAGLAASVQRLREVVRASGATAQPGTG